jgi:outer membrane protein insertion porin family
VLERYARIVGEAAGTKVEGHLRYTSKGEPSIVFRPPGDAPRISEVHFTGNEVLTTEQLSAKFILVAFGTEYTEQQARALLDADIRPLYEAKGRLRVAFSTLTVAASKDPDNMGVSVTVSIVEGPEYKLGGVKFQGVATKQVKEMETLADFKKDETANFAEVDKSLEKIRKRYQGTGYLHATATAERTLNDKDHIVDLLVKVEPGPLYSYGKLDIQGLDLISEPAIRKMWGPREGKPFDPTSPDAFLKEIREQGLFDNLGETKSQTKVNEGSKTADVTLIFKGGQPAQPKQRPAGF